MAKQIILFALCTLLLAPCSAADAQQSGKVPRIGFLITSSPSAIAPRMDAFRQGLHELGYAEGKNIVIERRHADGNSDQLAALAAELVRLNVDVIVTSGPTATRSAKAATSAIPIVMTFDDDPVGSGFVASLAQPGGNVTGLDSFPGDKRQTIGACKRDRPRPQPSRCHRDFNQTRHRPDVKGNGARSTDVRGEAAISRHTTSQGH